MIKSIVAALTLSLALSTAAKTPQDYRNEFNKVKSISNILLQDESIEKLKDDLENKLSNKDSKYISATLHAVSEYDDIFVDPKVQEYLEQKIEDLSQTVLTSNYRRSTSLIDKELALIKRNLEVIKQDENYALSLLSLQSKFSETKNTYEELLRIKEWTKLEHASVYLPKEDQNIFFNTKELPKGTKFELSEESVKILKNLGFKKYEIVQTNAEYATMSLSGQPKEYNTSIYLPIDFSFTGMPEKFPNHFALTYVIGENPKIIKKNKELEKKRNEQKRKADAKISIEQKELEARIAKQKIQNQKQADKRAHEQREKQKILDHTKRYGVESDYFSFKIRLGAELSTMWETMKDDVLRSKMKERTLELYSSFPQLQLEGYDVMQFQFEKQNYDESKFIPKSTPEVFGGPSIRFDYKQGYLKMAYLWNMTNIIGDLPYLQGKVYFQGIKDGQLEINGSYTLALDVENIARVSVGTRSRKTASPVGIGVGADILFLKETMERRIEYNSSGASISNYSEEKKFTEVRGMVEMGFMLNHFELNVTGFLPITHNRYRLPPSIGADMALYLF